MRGPKQNQQLTYSRMYELNEWTRAFRFFQWCLVVSLLYFLFSLSTIVMWWLGELASKTYPVDDRAAREDFLYASWQTAPAVFYAIVSMTLSILIVRLAASRLWPKPRLYRPWLNPSDAAIDFLKIAVATGIATASCFYGTFVVATKSPAMPAFMKPPSVIKTDSMTMLKEWLATRGLQFILVGCLAFLLAHFVLRLNRGTIIPTNSRHLAKVLIGYIAVFEILYLFSRPVLGFLFFGSYGQAVALVETAATFFIFLFIFILLFVGAMVFLSRRLVRPDFPVDCNIVVAAPVGTGKTRFFGEALRSVRSMLLKGFHVKISQETEAFLEKYEKRRNFFVLDATSAVTNFSFSIEKLEEVVRFNWQDAPGGITIGRLNEDQTQLWRSQLRAANALCLFLDAQAISRGGLKNHPDIGDVRAVPFQFIREIREVRDFHRNPVICLIATKMDLVAPEHAKRVKLELEGYRQECLQLMREAGIPRFAVKVFLTTTMENMRGREVPMELTDADRLPVSEPEPENCKEVLLWVAAKIIEAKSLGLDGPKAMLSGRKTAFGELQLDLEELAGG